MKHKQKIGQTIVILMVLLGITSCNKDSSIEAFEVIGDVMIIKRMVGEQSYFARSYYAYGNYPMASGKVALPEGGSITLTSPDETKRTYFKEPAFADFGTVPPRVGTFDFTVVNEDIEHTVSDLLVFNNLPYATVTKANYDGGAIMVEWTSVPAAANYMVKMVTQDYEPVFSGYLLAKNINLYQISNTNGTWESSPENGVTYIVEVHAFEYDDEATTGNYVYNINEISIATKTVVWGE